MIDLRSDTVTRPTDGMRDAIRDAEVGDDVYGEDPTVDALASTAAERLGTEAALMVPSGTQGNLVSLLTHCQRGDEYIVGEDYHDYFREAGGASVLGGIKSAPLEVREDGSVAPEAIRDAIKPEGDPHFARSALLSLENPTGGRVLSPEYLREACDIADEHGLSTHLDGARIFNAAVALDVPPREIATPFDSVMFTLSKGLGAPVGSVVCGSADFIERARRWRKMVGGGWRQAGILASAGLHALDHHVDRLEEDHRNARRLADGLADLPGLEVDDDGVQTNMVFAELRRGDVEELAEFLRTRGIAIHPMTPLRLVTHLDVAESDVETVIDAVETFLD